MADFVWHLAAKVDGETSKFEPWRKTFCGISVDTITDYCYAHQYERFTKIHKAMKFCPECLESDDFILWTFAHFDEPDPEDEWSSIQFSGGPINFPAGGDYATIDLSNEMDLALKKVQEETDRINRTVDALAMQLLGPKAYETLKKAIEEKK